MPHQVTRAGAPFHMMAKPIGPACNIVCDYCFYLPKMDLFSGQGRSDFAMSQDVLENYVRDYIGAQPEGTQEVTFAWQGGEPLLLGTPFYEEAMRLQAHYARPGMRVSNALQTNATLMSRERARWFRDHGFLIGVSIDGPEDLHDRYRRTKAGTGTFRDVLRGIEHLRAVGVDFNTLTVVQSDNADHPIEVYDLLTSIGSGYLQFIPIVERPRTERTVAAAQWGTFLSTIFDQWLRNDVGRVHVQHFEMLLGMYLGLPASLCVHAPQCGHAIAIEHDGSLYSCDHFVTEKNRIGSLADGGLGAVMNGNKQRAFGANKSRLLPNRCRKCPYLWLCNGGCPKDRLNETSSGRLNWLCTGYAAIYAHTQPTMEAMARAVRSGQPAQAWRHFR